MNTVFHYIHTYTPAIGFNTISQRIPVVTICYIKDEFTGKIARGMSVCSPTEDFIYRKGQAKAFGLAVAAMKMQKDSRFVQGEKGIKALTRAVKIPIPSIKIAKSKWDVNERDCLDTEDLETFRRFKNRK